MTNLCHRLCILWWDARICLTVQWHRVRLLWKKGHDPLWQWNWRQIAAGIAAMKLRRDREEGREPSDKSITAVRRLESAYGVPKRRI